LLLRAGERRAVIRVDFVVHLAGRAAMVVRFGPGSIVSRERPALAMARLIAPYQIPVVVVTNGEDAEVLDGPTGAVVGRGLDAIPDRPALEEIVRRFDFLEIPAARAEVESRVAYCYEVDGACPCDDTVCRLEGRDEPAHA
jgi:hypothetical protein